MKALRKLLDTVLNVLAGGSFVAMTLLTCWQVFTRYVLSNPSSWSEELVGYLFAWMSLLGACLVIGERGHMNIPLLVERVKPAMQKILSIFAEVIAGVFTATEGSAIAVVYALILGVCYKNITLKGLWQIIILLIMNVILLISGIFMDVTPAILIFTPLFLPVVKTFGMNPVHFGLMAVTYIPAVSIGLPMAMGIM